jgi:hypothetical protein
VGVGVVAAQRVDGFAAVAIRERRRSENSALPGRQWLEWAQGAVITAFRASR